MPFHHTVLAKELCFWDVLFIRTDRVTTMSEQFLQNLTGNIH